MDVFAEDFFNRIHLGRIQDRMAGSVGRNVIDVRWNHRGIGQSHVHGVFQPRTRRRLFTVPLFTIARNLQVNSSAPRFGSFEVFSPSIPIESAPSATTEAAAAAFEQAGIGPGDVDIAQLQDTESGAEVMHLAETGLCEHGEQEALISRGDTELGGRLPINTDGGCLACGEPIGASGLRQVHEIVLQLRGEAGDRQVPTPCRVGFTQVYGAPGVSACTVLTV